MRSYIARFKKKALLIDKANDKILVIHQQSVEGDALLAREEKLKKRERQEDARQETGWKMIKTRD